MAVGLAELRRRAVIAGGTRDGDLRRILRARLAGEQPNWALILDELGLNHGDVRVDVAVINGKLHGYELKSDRDSLDRLPRQVSAYSSVLDFASLVVGDRHLLAARALVPTWWGIFTPSDGGLAQWREPRENPSVDALSRARLLWRDEALTLLDQAGAARGMRSRPRAVLYERLVSALGRDRLCAEVTLALHRRKDWR